MFSVICVAFSFFLPFADTVTLQTYFFLPTFAVTLAFPILIAVNNTLFFVFLLSLTIFFLSTHHLTFFLLFFRFNLKLFPLTRVTFFLFSSTFFPFASSNSALQPDVMQIANVNPSAKICFFI